MLLIAAVLSTNLTVFAAEEAGSQEKEAGIYEGPVELIFLMDVSGSMTVRSDPPSATGNRLSTEAAEVIAFNTFTNSSMKVKVIPYHHDVYTGFKSVDVRTESGLATYQDYIEAIRVDKNDDKNKDNEDTVPGIACWNRISFTDIGFALEEAVKALNGADSDPNARKAVILFTDGEIDLKDESKEPESEQRALAAVEGFNTVGDIPDADDTRPMLFSIGLDAGNKGYVDKGFFARLHGVENVADSKGNIQIINSADQIASAMLKVIANLHGIAEPEMESAPINKDIPVDIYENAVKEANINFMNDREITSISVKNPAGVEVAYVDLNDESKNKIDESLCTVNYTGMKQSATVKLIAPQGGEWNIRVSGPTESKLGQIKMFMVDLKVADTLGSQVYIGDKLTYSAELHTAGTDTRLTDSGLYASEGAESTVKIVPADGGSERVIKGTVNESKNGYNYEVEFPNVGEYTLITTIGHSKNTEFTASSVKTVKVVGPNIMVYPASAEGETDTTPVGIRFTNPTSDAAIVSDIPQYIKDQTLELIITDPDGNESKEVIAMSEFDGDGEFIYDFAAEKEGKHTFKAVISHNGKVEMESAACEMSIVPDRAIIDLGKLVASHGKKAFDSAYSHADSLDACFSEKNGNPLYYSVTVKGDPSIKAEIKDGKLMISAEDYGSAEVILTVTNGLGEELTRKIDVSIESKWPFVIGFIVGFGAVAVLAVIAILVINKKKIISVAFKLKVERVDSETFNSTEIVYSVPKLSSNKLSKPTMTLAQILTINGLARVDYGNMPEQDLMMFKQAQAPQITLTGVPFQNAFKITVKSNDKKKGDRVYTFKGNNVAVRTPDGAYTITFGNNRAFGQGNAGGGMYW